MAAADLRWQVGDSEGPVTTGSMAAGSDPEPVKAIWTIVPPTNTTIVTEMASPLLIRLQAGRVIAFPLHTGSP